MSQRLDVLVEDFQKLIKRHGEVTSSAATKKKHGMEAISIKNRLQIILAILLNYGQNPRIKVYEVTIGWEEANPRLYPEQKRCGLEKVLMTNINVQDELGKLITVLMRKCYGEEIKAKIIRIDELETGIQSVLASIHKKTR